jgi:hypothetical protein
VTSQKKLFFAISYASGCGFEKLVLHILLSNLNQNCFQIFEKIFIFDLVRADLIF